MSLFCVITGHVFWFVEASVLHSAPQACDSSDSISPFSRWAAFTLRPACFLDAPFECASCEIIRKCYQTWSHAPFLPLPLPPSAPFDPRETCLVRKQDVHRVPPNCHQLKLPSPSGWMKCTLPYARGLQWVNTSQSLPGGISLLLEDLSEELTVGFCCQVLPAGPPAGAGQSGSADQRKQEEMVAWWEPTSSNQSHQYRPWLCTRLVPVGMLIWCVEMLNVLILFCFFLFLCRGHCMSWIRWVSITLVYTRTPKLWERKNKMVLFCQA